MSAELPTSSPVDNSLDGRRLAKRLALAIDAAVPGSTGMVVLAYHRVGRRTNSPVDLSTSMFRRQLAHLAAAAAVVSLDEGIDSLQSPDQGQRFPTVLTFDDGTADFVDVVLPALVEYSIPATLYVSTAFVDGRLWYPADGEPISWAGLREAASTGLVTIGAHTHRHRLLDRCSVDTAQLELDICNQRIADELQIVPEHFAYPKAVQAEGPIETEVKARYRSAAVAGTRANNPKSFDPHRLFRSPIQEADGWEGFVRKLEGGMRAEDDIRRLVNRVRYRGKAA